MNQVYPNHRQYLAAAARAFCSVCLEKTCRRSRKEQSACISLLEFRKNMLRESSLFIDKSKGKTTKVCNKCGQEKPISEFYRLRKNKDGFHHTCKACVSKSSKERYASKKQASLSVENTQTAREMKKLQHLLGRARPVVVDINESRRLRYQLDEDYKNSIKEYAKKQYYDSNLYLSRKFLNRYKSGLAKAERELEQLRKEIPNLSGKELYKAKMKESTRVAKIASYNYKIALCRAIIEGKMKLTEEEMREAELFRVKSTLIGRVTANEHQH